MKYEKESVCPSALSEYVELVNKLPKKYEDIQSINDKLFDVVRRPSYYINNQFGSLDDNVRLIVGSSGLISYLIDDREEVIDFMAIYNRFVDLQKAKKLFESIANAYRFAMNVESHGGFPNDPVYYSQKFFRHQHSLEFTIEMGIDNKGLVKPRYSGILEVFAKEKISFSRIRICAICEDIFWAKKMNAETCGERTCASTLYNRRRLKKNKKAKEAKKELEQKKKAERLDWKNQDFSS